jgi:outer membrane biosynthesis protein TonB
LITLRFLKPITVTLAGAGLLALPFAGGAFADSSKPHPTPTVTQTTQPKTPKPTSSPKTPKPTSSPKTPKPTSSPKHSSSPTKVRTKEPAPAPRRTSTEASWVKRATSLSVSVNPTRVKAGSSYGVTVVVKGGSSNGTATITSPEGKSYQVSLSQHRATKTLTVPSRTKSGAKTVKVKVGNRVATAQFTVVSGNQRDDHSHTGS